MTASNQLIRRPPLLPFTRETAIDAREHRELVNQLSPEPLRCKVARLFLIQVVACDWNCPQYITPRFTAAEVEKYAAALKARLADLESQFASRDRPEGIDESKSPRLILPSHSLHR